MLEIGYKQWLKKCKNTLFLLLFGIVFISAQNPNNRSFSSGSEIVVDVLPGNDIYYSHVCDQGISIYNLAEVFQVNKEKLLRENKIDPKKPNYDGKVVKIPVSKSKLITNQNFKTYNQTHLKVSYIVKKGDNLYKIANEYFDTDVSTLATINKKKTNDVKVGEQLQIGWILLHGVHNPDKNSKEKTPILKNKNVMITEKRDSKAFTDSDKEMGSVKKEEVKIIKYYLSDVIGFYDRSAGNIKSYYVLHNEARPGSLMDVYNPMLKKHIKAKVLGKLPEGTYADDVQIIISSAVAKDLGILDARFKVNIKYEE
jgi:LysM repeat protein